jgi:KDO2-lipid IV(A) lauroyltransferase
VTGGVSEGAAPGAGPRGVAAAARERPPTLAHRLEYAALRTFLAALEPLGPARAGAVAGAFARFAYRPLGIRRGVVERQVAAAFPNASRDEVRRIARESYDNLARVAVEGVQRAARGRDAVLDAFDDSPDWAVVEAARARGRGLVMIGGHAGNWELMGAYLAARLGAFHAIARGIGNPYVDRYVRRVRERLGMHILHDQDAVRAVPRLLRQGDAVGFLSDQAAVGLASTFVPFFGRPAKTPRGAAVFALRFGAPVVAAHAIRQDSGQYRMLAEEIPVGDSGDRERDVDDVMRRFTEVLERVVRAHPGQYFWQHRRWKHQPPDTPPHLRGP